MAQAPKPTDKFAQLKYIGWCWSQLPPEDAAANLADFVNHAKFQLCTERNVLMKSPVWDKYSDEEILAEYFAMIFVKSEEARKDFVIQLSGKEIEEDIEWMERQEQENAEFLAQTEEFEFSPESIGD